MSKSQDNNGLEPTIPTAEAVRHAHNKYWKYYTKGDILETVSGAIVDAIGETTEVTISFEKKFVNREEFNEALKELRNLGYETFIHYNGDSSDMSLAVSWGDGRKWYQRSEVLLPYGCGIFVIAMFIFVLFFAFMSR